MPLPAMIEPRKTLFELQAADRQATDGERGNEEPGTSAKPTASTARNERNRGRSEPNSTRDQQAREGQVLQDGVCSSMRFVDLPL